MNPEEALLLAIVCLGAFFIPFVSRRLFLPTAVGEIVFGLALGLFFKNASLAMPTIKFLSELGFLILMYIAGLEIDFQHIKAAKKNELAVYLAFFAVVIGLAFYARDLLRQPAIYTLIYLATAIGLLVPVLKDTGILREEAGQKILVIGSLGEVLSLAALTFFALYFASGISIYALISLLEIIAFFVIAYLLLKAFRLYVWWNPLKIGAFLNAGDPSETGMRANFVNLFVFVALAALFGVEPIVGAFLAGMLFALVFRQREIILERMNSFGYGFLVPLFFVGVGLRFDVREFCSRGIVLDALTMCGVIFLIRAVAALLFSFSKLSFGTRLLIPFALSFPLTLLIAVATIGLDMHILTNAQAMTITLTAILTALAYPWLFKGLVKYI